MYLTEVERHIANSFSQLEFYEKRHLYRVGNTPLPSVSSLISKLTPKFNKEFILPAAARKLDIEPELLDWQWREKNRVACELGHRTHEFLEKYTGLETPTSPQEEAGIAYIRSLEGKYRISFRELRAYSRKYMYAGTMDLPLEVIEGNSYEIADYKTNSTDLFKAYSMLLPPFNRMEASAYNKYQIQLSLYQIMLEEIGLYISNRRLVHLRDDKTYKVYDLEDMTEDLKDYMASKQKVA